MIRSPILFEAACSGVGCLDAHRMVPRTPLPPERSMFTALLVTAPALVGAPAPAAQPTFGAPLPTAILRSISQDLANLNDALDAETDLSHAGEEVHPAWTGSLFVGGTQSSGNTEQNQASSRFSAERRGIDNRISLLAFWNYSDQTDKATDTSSIVERNWGSKAQYDHFFHDDLYGYANGATFADSVQDLDLRTTLGAGAGYQVFEDDDKSLGVEGGLAWVNEDYSGKDSDASYTALRAAYRYRNELTETTRFEQDIEGIMGLEDPDDVIVRADTRLRVQINESLWSSLQWVVDYDNTPAAGKERVDSRVSVGVTWEF
jgi:putative salt-induced outer membrane protein YdiY